MKNDDRILHRALRVAHRRAQRGVVQAQFGQHFAGAKMEIAQDKIAVVRVEIGQLLAMHISCQ